MVRLPWRGSDDGSDGDDEEWDVEETDVDADRTASDASDDVVRLEPVVSCEFKHANLFVYDDHVHIERLEGSNFEDTSIPMDEVTGVDFSEGVMVGYIQVEQVGTDTEAAGFLQAPVDANTCHFGRSGRDCAKTARDAILQRARG